VDGGQWKRSNRESISMETLFSGLHDASEEMKKSAIGLLYLTRVMEGVRDDVTRDGELSEAALQRVFVRFGNEANALTGELRGFREKLKANPGGLTEEALKEEHRRTVLGVRRAEPAVVQGIGRGTRGTGAGWRKRRSRRRT